jgi:metal-responsive CopG/Arc/MetJ family transcriptional regulator
MKKKVKFTISMPQEVFTAIEDYRRETGRSRSSIVLEAVSAWLKQNKETRRDRSPAVKEERSGYGVRSFLSDKDELRKRAIAAAGQFHSKTGDLSTDHDKVLSESYAGKPHPDRCEEKGDK